LTCLLPRAAGRGYRSRAGTCGTWTPGYSSGSARVSASPSDYRRRRSPPCRPGDGDETSHKIARRAVSRVRRVHRNASIVGGPLEDSISIALVLNGRRAGSPNHKQDYECRCPNAQPQSNLCPTRHPQALHRSYFGERDLGRRSAFLLKNEALLPERDNRSPVHSSVAPPYLCSGTDPASLKRQLRTCSIHRRSRRIGHTASKHHGNQQHGNGRQHSPQIQPHGPHLSSKNLAL